MDSIDAGRCDAEIVGVASDRPSAGALERARTRGIPTCAVRPSDHADRDAWDRTLGAAVGAWSPDLVVCAGFMRLLGAPFLMRFRGRTINIHPSLLPSFPGRDGPAQAIRAGVAIAGCTGVV